MPARTTIGLSLIVFIGTLILSGPRPAEGVPYDPDLPFTYLFDTGSSAAEPLSREGLAEKTGWTLVDEEASQHEFQGDAVFSNDKLLVALRRKGPGAEVYTRNGPDWKSRAVLMSLSGRSTAVSGASSIRILENSPAAVMLQAEFTTSGPGGACSSTFRLTTGQRTVEMQAGAGADRLFVWCRPRWVVVPDFFGDDMIFGPQSFGPHPAAMARRGLPTENLLLSLIRGGDAMIMAVWPSGRQASHAIADGQGPDRTILGCEIEGAENEPLWVAFFEGQTLWHEEAISADTPPARWTPDFQPPFDAQWRADLVGPDGFAVSHLLAASDESPGQPVSTADPHPKGNGASTRDGAGASAADSTPLVIYPLDRTRKTPLTAFCPTDVIRNVLGVGPCQYVLQTEGLTTETNPTPDQVMTRIERLFESNKQAQAADEIRKLLKQMTEHVGHVQARIDEYARFAVQADQFRAVGIPGQGENREPGRPAVDERLGPTIDRLQRIISAYRDGPDPAELAAELSDRIVDLLDKPDSLAECQRFGRQLRDLGTAQDTTLSKCRMTIRWLQRQAAVLAGENPPDAERAEQLRADCRRLLANR